MKTSYRKIAKLVTLLVTSLMIATASVQAYQAFMYMEGSIIVGSQKIVWIYNGAEDPDDTVLVSLTGLEPGKTLTFNGTAYLKNKDTSNYTIVSIEVTKAVGSNFEICKAYIYENFTTSGTWTLVGTLNLASEGSKIENKQLQADGYYKFDFEIRASSSGSDTFKIKVTYQ
ncbi:MAG: hypothetical protein QXK18_06015 [Candidatus Bathyarchaeia archaeon]